MTFVFEEGLEPVDDSSCLYSMVCANECPIGECLIYERLDGRVLKQAVIGRDFKRIFGGSYRLSRGGGLNGKYRKRLRVLSGELR